MKSIEGFLAEANARLERRSRQTVFDPRAGLCGAFARSTGKPCKRKALPNGRCRNHGGLSTGPRTADGKAKALANLKQYQLPVQ